MKEIIRIYSTPTCPYCLELKGLLNEENIKFVDINVLLPENEDEYNQLYEITKSDDVPIIKLGKKILVPNISFNSIPECFLMIKDYLI